MKTAYALLLITGGGILIWSAFRTPPDPRLALMSLIRGAGLGDVPDQVANPLGLKPVEVDYPGQSDEIRNPPSTRPSRGPSGGGGSRVK